MSRNKVLLASWILSYGVYCSNLCVDIAGRVEECEYGCCGNKPDRYCCSFHVWIIIVSIVAAATVLIPTTVILLCCIIDRTCSRKRTIQTTTERQSVQLRAITRVHNSLNNVGSASAKNSGSLPMNTASSASNLTAHSSYTKNNGSVSMSTLNSTSTKNTASSSSMYVAGSSFMNNTASSSVYGGINPGYT